MADEVLCTLISASEKASKIARLFRKNDDLFSLLIQKKGERNNEVDFKTFVDVFIQQIVTTEVSLKFGELGENVKGEENNLFTGPNGETVAVEIMPDVEKTTALLMKILNNNKKAAKILADAAHGTISIDMNTVVDPETLKQISSSKLDLTNLGIWIDPIDCTSQYVLGKEDVNPNDYGVYENGLQCVLVLIGVYCLDTGLPVMGVVNQPFHTVKRLNQTERWEGRCIWGYAHNGICKNNISKVLQRGNRKPLVVLSLHDGVAISELDKMSSIMSKCLSRGAGYKCITVIDHSTDVFLYTYDGSYKWDTCGPHAILLSCGGGIANLSSVIKCYGKDDSILDEQVDRILVGNQVLYKEPLEDNLSKNWKANAGGIIVYNGTKCSQNVVHKLLTSLSKLTSLSGNS